MDMCVYVSCNRTFPMVSTTQLPPILRLLGNPPPLASKSLTDLHTIVPLGKRILEEILKLNIVKNPYTQMSRNALFLSYS